MRSALALVLWVLGLLGPACATEPQAPSTMAAEDPSRQVLVMLHLPKAHYRPDSSYAGAYGDGVGQQARKFAASALARKHGLSLISDWPMPLASVDCHLMSLAEADTRSPAEVAQSMEREAGVAWAQAMNLYRAEASTQPDPLYATQPAAQAWRLAELHGLATGRGVRIAVIDSGIEGGHPDLAGQLASNENFVDGKALAGENHGTAVAGIIAAKAGNGLGIAGVAPQARLLGLRACWQAAETLCTSLSLAKALHAAIQQDAHIVNMSLSGPDDRLLGVLLDQALARGMAVVTALGTGVHRFPASHPGVIAVSGTEAGAGSNHALLAPGKDIPSTAPGGSFALVSGASFAAAHVAGLLALTRELDGGKPGLQRAALVSEPGGRIDAWASVSRRGGPKLAAAGQAPP